MSQRLMFVLSGPPQSSSAAAFLHNGLHGCRFTLTSSRPLGSVLLAHRCHLQDHNYCMWASAARRHRAFSAHLCTELPPPGSKLSCAGWHRARGNLLHKVHIQSTHLCRLFPHHRAGWVLEQLVLDCLGRHGAKEVCRGFIFRAPHHRCVRTARWAPVRANRRGNK